MKKVLTILILGLTILAFSGCEKEKHWNETKNNRITYSYAETPEEEKAVCEQYVKGGVKIDKYDPCYKLLGLDKK